MSLLLHIDTAVDTASVCLSDGLRVLAHMRNEQPRESAAWLQPAIRQLLGDAGYTLAQLEAVSVSAGPGSYTGLRVGMASAKGLCYALQVPLITVSTLGMMTVAARRVVPDAPFYGALIDARRMEVFAGIYDRDLQVILPPHNLILDEQALEKLQQYPGICFFGNGSNKLKPLLAGTSASFADVVAGAPDLVPIAFENFSKGHFADLAYAEPFYIKAFYTGPSRS